MCDINARSPSASRALLDADLSRLGTAPGTGAAPGRAADELIARNDAANAALVSALSAEATAVRERLEAKRTALATAERERTQLRSASRCPSSFNIALGSRIP